MPLKCEEDTSEMIAVVIYFHRPHSYFRFSPCHFLLGTSCCSGVDCPELAKNKKQTTQPYGDEAKQFTEILCLHKVVKITLLRKDQYGRAVCAVETMPTAGVLFRWVPGRGRKDVSIELAKAGMAELYTGGGAEYFNQREVIESVIAEAKRQKRGIWSLKNRVSAAEQKRILKSGEVLPRLQDVSNQQSRSRAAEVASRGGGGAYKAASATLGGALSSKQKPTQPVTVQKKSAYRSTALEAVMTGLELVQ